MILDVRTVEEYKDGHIEGAVNIPVDQIEESDIQGAAKDEAIAVYCRSGGRAGVAVSILEKMGYTNVTLYNNGRYQ